VGYVHIDIELSGKPCVESISRECGLKTNDVTCEGVTRELRRADVVVFQKLILGKTITS